MFVVFIDKSLSSECNAFDNSFAAFILLLEIVEAIINISFSRFKITSFFDVIKLFFSSIIFNFDFSDSANWIISDISFPNRLFNLKIKDKRSSISDNRLSEYCKLSLYLRKAIPKSSNSLVI